MDHVSVYRTSTICTSTFFPGNMFTDSGEYHLSRVWFLESDQPEVWTCVCQFRDCSLSGFAPLKIKYHRPNACAQNAFEGREMRKREYMVILQKC